MEGITTHDLRGCLESDGHYGSVAYLPFGGDGPRAERCRHQDGYLPSYAFEPGIFKREGNTNRFCREVSPTIRTKMGDNQTTVMKMATCFKGNNSAKARSIGYERETAYTIGASNSGIEPMLVSFSAKPGEMIRLSEHPKIAKEICQTLTKSDGKLGDNQPTVIAFAQNTREEVRSLGDAAGALSAAGGTHQSTYVCVREGVKCLCPHQPQTKRVFDPNEAFHTLSANTGKAGQDILHSLNNNNNTDTDTEGTSDMMAEVRRLTPGETSLLMGMPKEHLQIRGSSTPDAAVYSCNGNGWARNCSRFVFKRIHEVDGRVNGCIRPFKIGSVSSGQGTHEMSVKDFGDKSVFCADIAPFPCEVLATRFPDMPNFGDVTRIDYDAEKGVIHNRKKVGYQLMSEDQLGFKPVDAPEIEVPLKYGEMDCISGGLPCFTKGSFVLTDRGYKPIEEIKVGDSVVTHLGNVRKVIRVNNRKADNVVEVKAVSRPPFKVTSSHPFWTATAREDFRRHSPSYLKTLIENPRFDEIGAIGKGGVISLVNFNRTVCSIPTPTFPLVYTATDEQIAELSGWYIGDGYISRKKGKAKKEVILCLNEKKYDIFKKRFGNALNFCDSKDRGVYKVHICCTALADFFIANFGELSYAKRVPAWMMFAKQDLKSAFVRGYLATDGCRYTDKRNSSKGSTLSTVSSSLAFGIADVIGRSTVCAIDRGDKWIIEGRTVNQRPAWMVRSADNVRHYHQYGIWDFVRVKDIKSCDSETVYNMEVEGDNSYICNGFCVHNCTSVSVAGKRHGAAEGSGTRSALAYELPRIGKACGCRWLVYENVPGLASSNGGTDLAWFLYRLQEAGYSVAWRTLDAQYTRSDMHPRAVPQRRRRIWLVGYRGDDWRVPCEALFEPMKALGSEPPKRTVGVGYVSRIAKRDGSSYPTKSEKEEFVSFIGNADKRILDVLEKNGVCETVAERMKELTDAEKKDSVGSDDLFGFNGLDNLFGSTEEEHQGRGLKTSNVTVAFPGESDIRSLGAVKTWMFAKSVCQEVLFCGELFKRHEGSPTVDDLDEKMLNNIGNAGFLSNGFCVTMKMPEWNAGLTEEDLFAMPTELAELYDGDVCGLSDLLEENVDPKYRLSWRACYGILRRAVNRGKQLPIELGYALVERMVTEAGKVKWYAINGKDTVKKEGDQSERAIAKIAYDTYVAPMLPFDEVEAVAPKSDEPEDTEDVDEGEDLDDGVSDPDSDEIAKIGNGEVDGGDGDESESEKS